MEKILEFLKSVSAGKYSSVFNHRGRSYHASAVGGVITLFLGAVLFTAAVFIMKNVFLLKIYNVKQNSFALTAVNSTFVGPGNVNLNRGQEICFSETNQECRVVSEMFEVVG
jgi:uncharacterized metal-binding protein